MNNEELLKAFMFLLWCQSHGEHPSLCKSTEDFNRYLYEAKEHRGDCTKDACPCLRCHMQQLEVDAQGCLDYLEHESKGTWLKLIEIRSKNSN